MSVPLEKSIDKELIRRHVRLSSPRVLKLLEEIRRAVVKVSVERAKLITEFYKKCDEELECRSKPTPVKKALAFKYLMERVSLLVEDGQLIVGLRGTGIKEVPTFPEICCHTVKDLEVLNSREKMPYRADSEVFKIHQEEIISY